jgi:predicted nucleic acid-binding protein
MSAYTTAFLSYQISLIIKRFNHESKFLLIHLDNLSLTAAHAIETGSVLITYDAHFAKLPGLRLWYHFPE